MATADKSGENVIFDARADTLGEIKDKIDALKADADVIESAFKDLGPAVYAGENWKYTVTETVRWTLNSEELDTFLRQHGRCLDDFKSPSNAVVSGKLSALSLKLKKALEKLRSR